MSVEDIHWFVGQFFEITLIGCSNVYKGQIQGEPDFDLEN